MNMMKKAKILDTDRLSIVEFLEVVEKYHANDTGHRLSEKLSENNFRAYLKAHPKALKINVEVQARKDYLAKVEEAKKANENPADVKPVVNEIEEDVRRHREETETAELQKWWVQQTLSEHVIYVKGSEIVFYEFKEILFELARKLKDKIDPKTGKLSVVLKKFIEDWLLRRLTSFVKFKIPAQPVRGKEATRVWPESAKDVIIRVKAQQMRLEQEAARAKAAEQERIAHELKLMQIEDTPALDMEEIAELRRRAFEQEEAERIAREAEEEAALAF